MCRGVPELSVALTWINTLDKTLKAQADRAKLDANFFWDVTLKGKSQEQCDAWAKKYWVRPRPGAVRVHNENAEVKAVFPQLGSADMEKHVNLIRTHIVGGYGFPLHWFGSGADANLATASVMAEPTRKALRRKQKAFRRMIADIVRFTLLRAQEAGALGSSIKLDTDPFDVQMPDLSGPDMAKSAIAIQGVLTSLTIATDNGFISEDTARELAAAILSETGIEVDAAKEKEQVEREKKKNDEEDEKDGLDRERDLADEMRTMAGKAGETDLVEPVPPRKTRDEK